MGCSNSKKSFVKNETDSLSKESPNKILSTAEAIAYKNGYEKWDSVSEIQFTFNVDRGDKHSERSWIWKPKTQDVTMIREKDTVRYNRAHMDSLDMKTDAIFINDKFWLLAPFNIVWDKGTSFTEKQNAAAPISKDTLNQLTVLYGKEGGYTPGDAYDFFYGKDFMVKEWIFRQANADTPSMMTTWEDYEDFNGLKLAKMRKNGTGNFKLYFTNVVVKRK